MKKEPTLEEAIFDTAKKVGQAVDEFRSLFKAFVESPQPTQCLTPKQIADATNKRALTTKQLLHMIDCDTCGSLFKTYHASKG